MMDKNSLNTLQKRLNALHSEYQQEIQKRQTLRETKRKILKDLIEP